MASTLKRVSAPTERAISAIAATEDRTFVAQLDRVVDAGMAALGLPAIDRSDDDTPPPTPAPRKATKARAGARK